MEMVWVLCEVRTESLYKNQKNIRIHSVTDITAPDPYLQDNNPLSDTEKSGEYYYVTQIIIIT